MFLSVQEKDATKAATMCSALATPSRAEKAELSRLFAQSSSQRKRPASTAFDPMVESVALSQIKKKKLLYDQFIVMLLSFSTRIPHKGQKQFLQNHGRVKTLMFN